MAKHVRIRTDEQRERLERNRETLLSVMSGGASLAADSTQRAGLTLVLERFVTSGEGGPVVGYEGQAGVERLLFELARTYQGGEVVADGRLVGVRGTLAIEGHDEAVALLATVGVGAQLVLELGPVSSIEALLDAIRVFDRQLHLAGVALGSTAELCAQGYNPSVTSPSDVVPVPIPRNVLLNAHLSRTGRYSRDALRCTAATRLRLPMREEQEQAVEDYRIAAALSPLIAFLTDNTLSVRGTDPRKLPRMARRIVWDQVDAERCSLAAGSFVPRFGLRSYERWVEGIRPILFESDEGVTFSIGGDSCQRLMEERDLSPTEARRLLGCVMSDVVWNGTLEIAAADALPPRMAAGYAALAKGLFASDESRSAVVALIDLADIDEDAVAAAWAELREQGWDGRVYGRLVGPLVRELVSIARRALEEPGERALLDAIAQLWEVNSVPRDMLLRNWERARRDREGEAIALYGEGAVIPFDQLAGEPPEGSTSVMHFERS